MTRELSELALRAAVALDGFVRHGADDIRLHAVGELAEALERVRETDTPTAVMLWRVLGRPCARLDETVALVRAKAAELRDAEPSTAPALRAFAVELSRQARAAERRDRRHA